MTLYEDRLDLARAVAQRVIERWGSDVRAIALEGSMARGPSAVDHRSDIDLVVVAREPKLIPEREVFVGDVLVSMGVTSADDLLEEADELRWDWAMASESLVNFAPLHDPDGFFDDVRRRHEQTTHETSDRERAERARALLMGAYEYVGKGRRSVEGGSAPAASVCVTEALITIALSVGLLTRTRWSGSHLAVAGAAEAGGSIDGFAAAYGEATDERLSLPDRLDAARRACDVLRSHYDALGAHSEVASVDELFG